MKASLLAFGLVGLTLSAAFGQIKPPVLIGIDVLKPILSVVTPSRPAYRLVEATVKIRLATTYLSVIGGYGQARSDTVHRNMLLRNGGYYLKVGLEALPRFQSGLVKGWHGLIASCHETGTYSFKGPTFGDYVASTPERQRVALGIEGVAGHQMILGQKLLLQLCGRVTTAALLGSKSGGTPIYFVPGVGNVVGSTFVFSVGLNVHLLYQL